jgi:hypothetical protein
MENIFKTFFEISFLTLNLFSFILGMFFAATMWRVKAMYFVAFYFILVALYFGYYYEFGNYVAH